VKRLMLLSVVISCLALLAVGGCSSPDEKANKLYVEATELVKKGQEVEKASYSDASRLFDNALAKIHMITSKYPSSQLAVKFAQGEVKIASYTIAEFEAMVRYLRIKAEAEETPLACAILTSNAIEKPYSKLEKLAAIAVKYAEAGQQDRASKILSQCFDVAKTIQSDSDNSRSLTVVAVSYAKIGQRVQSVEVLSAINSPFEKAFALVRIAASCAKAGRTDETLENLSQALVLAKTIDKVSSRDYILEEIAVKYAEIELCDQATQVAKIVESGVYKVSAICQIAGKCIDANQKDKATELLSQALMIANTIELPAPKALSLARIAVKYAEAGLSDQALETTKVIESVSDKSMALAEIALKYAENQKFDEALEVAKGIESPAHKGWSLARIVDELAKAGRFNQAMEVVMTIEGDPPKAWSLAHIGSEYAKAGKKDETVNAFTQALQVAEAINDDQYKLSALVEIVRTCMECGQYDRALQVTDMMKYDSYKAEELTKIAAQCVEAGQKEKANNILFQCLQLAKTIDDPSSVTETLIKVAGEYAKIGDKVDDRTKGVLHEIINEVATDLESGEAGPGKYWVKSQIRNRFARLWVWGDRYPQEGTDYVFGRYETAKGGQEGRITVTIKTKLFESIDNMHSGLPAPNYFAGEHTFTFYQDEYGNWHMGTDLY
jgi:tetratricopeptide (TPR) repeat protein